MKVSSGYYVNVFSEAGYDNCGLREKVDIFVVFHETVDEKDIDIDEIEEIVTMSIMDITDNEAYKKGKVDLCSVLKQLRYKVGKVLEEYGHYDTQVIVNFIP